MPTKNYVAPPNFLIFAPRISVTHFASPGMPLDAPVFLCLSGYVPVCNYVNLFPGGSFFSLTAFYV